MKHFETALLESDDGPSWLSDLLEAARNMLTNRPRIRAQCLPGGSHYQRPCPWVNCRYHAAFTEDEHGNVRGVHEHSSITGRRRTWPKEAQAAKDEIARLLDLHQRITSSVDTCVLETLDYA